MFRYNLKGIKGIKMVNNKLKILDEGKNKFVPEVIEMKKPEYVYKFEDEIRQMNLEHHKYDALVSRNEKIEKINEQYKICESFKRNEFLYNFLFETEVYSKVDFNKIAKYYNIIPFKPSVMINISPDWKAGDKRTNTCKIKILKQIINNYMKEGWYEKWDYVIECGSTGEHIHAHIVCKMNTQRLKSVETHLKKGNHLQQIKKYASKIKGMEGIIKGSGVQKTFLRTEILLKDKMDYLEEDLKPEGHKNLNIIPDGRISGCL
jgi:hypothetical protein